MKKNLVSLLFLISFLLVLISPPQSFAQLQTSNYFICYWNDALSQCRQILENHCDPGCTPDVSICQNCETNANPAACCNSYDAQFPKTCNCPVNTQTYRCNSSHICELCAPTDTGCVSQIDCANQCEPTQCKATYGDDAGCYITCPQDWRNFGNPNNLCGTGYSCCVPNTGLPSQTYTRTSAYCRDADISHGTTDTPTPYIYTAIGCLRVDNFTTIVTTVLGLGAGIAGGVAILLIIYGSFMVITSGGNPQRLTAGKELITAAVMGLLLLLFGAFVLKLVGIDILRIPYFGT